MNQNKENFEQFFEAQPFHQTLRFTEGNRLFICDVIDGVTTYRNLTVQACWATWQHLSNMEQCYIEKKKQVEDQQHRIDATEKMLAHSLVYVEQDRRGNFEFLQMAMVRSLSDTIKALRGNP